MAKNVTPAQFAQILAHKQAQVQTDLGKALAQSCALIQSTAIKSMRDTQIDSGKSYYTHNKTIAHHPSMPYNPPAVDTGTLRRSITYKVDEKNLVGRVGSILKNPPYGLYLEYGTSRMKPRPWLRPAVYNNFEKIKELFIKALKG